MNKVFKSVKYFLTLIIVATMILPYPFMAQARGNKYSIGETLAPDCAPGSTNCTVEPAQENNAYLTDIAGITATQGDVLYFNGTDWVNLGAGTSGYFLKTLGNGANPVWSANTTGVIILGTNTDGNYVKSLNSGIGISGGSSGSESAELTLNLDINNLTTESSINDADTLAIYDASSSAIRKISRANFLSGVTGALTYQGSWNANSNSPTLADNTGTKGQYYVITTAGSRDLGSGSISFTIGDWVIHNGNEWEKLDSTNDVQSVFGRSGAIAASSGDYIASQITNTASGNISAVTVQNALNELDTEKQGLDAQLTDIAGLTPTDSYFIVGNGTHFITENGDTLKSSIGIGNVENTALSTWAGTSNITTLGTIGTGIWHGTSLADAYVDDAITVSNYLPLAGGVMTGDLALNAQSDVRFADADSSNYVALQSPATVSSNVTWTLPNADGTNGQVLSTNGSGVLAWASTGSSDMTAVGSMTSGDAFADSTADDNWLGLGSSAGRIEFDDQATDEINILNANVGIGTASPDVKLDIQLPTTGTGDIVNLGNVTNGKNLVLGTNAGASTPYGYITHTGGQTTPDLVITNASNIGVGTKTPSGGLHVKTSPQWSSANYGASIIVDGARNNALGLLDNTSSNPWAIANSSGKLIFSTMPALGNTTTNANSRMTIDNTGNVGIGTDSPIDDLHIHTSGTGGDNNLRFTDHDTGVTAGDGLKIGLDSSENMLLVNYENTNMYFSTNGSTPDMTLNNSGNLGIGTNSPSWKLDVYNIENKATAYLRGQYYGAAIGTQATANPYYALAVYTGINSSGGSGTERFRVSANGNIGIGVSNPTSPLTIQTGGSLSDGIKLNYNSSNYAYINMISTKLIVTAGSGSGVQLINNDTAWSGYSDRRLKKNITKITNVLDKLENIDAVNFNWIDDAEDKDIQLGLIAQDVEKEFPEIVSGDGDEMKSLQYSMIGPIALQGVKELNKKLKEKDSEIQLLKSELCAKDNSYSWCE